MTAITEGAGTNLHRTIDWKGAFWVASGVPALVLFSIGGIAGTVGIPAYAVWIVSMLMGFIQSFTYAEIAGLFPNKSGGASVYGAAAWLRYSKFIAPLSVWCNWFAWSPVLSLGTSIAAGYILTSMAPLPDQTAIDAYIAANAGATADAATAALTPWIRTASAGSFTIFNIGFSFNATFFIGAILMLVCFLIQHRGILGTARVQTVFGLLVIIPMVIVGVVPLLNGNFHSENFSPFVPLAVAYAPDPGSWNMAGWTLVLGGMFIAGLVDLWIRDRGLLHQRIQESRHRYVQGHLLFRPALHPAVRAGADYVPRLSGADRHAGNAGGRRLWGCFGDGRYGRRRIVHPRDHGGFNDRSPDALHHDSDGRFVAHALPRLCGRLAPALSQPRQPPRRTDCGDVD